MPQEKVIAARQREYDHLDKLKVISRVLRSPVPKGTPIIPTMWIDKPKVTHAAETHLDMLLFAFSPSIKLMSLNYLDSLLPSIGDLLHCLRACHQKDA